MFRKFAIAVITAATAAGFMIADASAATKANAVTLKAKQVVHAKRVRQSHSADLARSRRVMRTKSIEVARLSAKNGRRPVPLPRPAPNKTPAS